MNTRTSRQSGNARLIVICVSLVLVTAGCVVGWLAKSASAESRSSPKKSATIKPPTYVALDPFTTNLQPEGGEKFVRASFTIQIAEPEQVELFNAHIAQVRNQLLLTLASKRPSEIADGEGKKHMVSEMHEELNRTFKALGRPGMVRGVFLTSFVMQY